MRKAFGLLLIGWPFAGLAFLIGWEFFVALAVTLLVVLSVFYGVYLLSEHFA